MKMEQTECSEMSAYKIQTPENYPEENIQHTEHSESLKSRMCNFLCKNAWSVLTGHIISSLSSCIYTGQWYLACKKRGV